MIASLDELRRDPLAGFAMGAQTALPSRNRQAAIPACLTGGEFFHLTGVIWTEEDSARSVPQHRYARPPIDFIFWGER